MVTAQVTIKTCLAIILTAAALMSAPYIRAASGNTQICQPSTTCEVGEFLYDDSYDPITDADCRITSRYPDGSSLFASVVMTAAAQNDGWYSHAFSAPATLGLYRTEVKCTTVGGEVLALDKTFEVQTAASTLSSSDVTSAVWNADRSSFNIAGSFGESLQSIIPSASDVATATWSYSGRTLTTFGTLVSSIWDSATRTLTGAGLSSGSLATKSELDSAVSDIKTKVETERATVSTAVSSNTTNIQNVNADLEDLKSLTEESRLLLERVVNKPIIETILENGSTANLQVKLLDTKSASEKLFADAQYIKSKASLMQYRWSKFSAEDIAVSVTELSGLMGFEKDNSSTGSVFGKVAYFQENWNFNITTTIYNQALVTKRLLLTAQNEVEKNGKSSRALNQIKQLSLQIASLEKYIGSKTDNPEGKTLFSQIRQTEVFVAQLNEKSNKAVSILATWNQQSYKEINLLSKDIASINKLPKINNIILTTVNKSDPEKTLKNKVLGLSGVVGANRVLLAQKPGKSISNTWLEEGSIVFKTLITNPSGLISQDVPIKYYLPREVKTEKIIKVDDGLTVSYDSDLGQYFVSGEFSLRPNETRTLSVTVDDSAFTIPYETLDTIKNQAEELSKPLSSTAYFAQGVTLKSDINASCDKIVMLQKNAVTPEDRIRAYREAQIELSSATEKLNSLKELTTQAGSVGTLFGFVGGTQAIAVWGLIIIMAAGFVFLVIYMRTLKVGGTQEVVVSKKKGKKQSEDQDTGTLIKHHFPQAKAFKIGISVIIFGFLSFSAVGLLTSRMNASKNLEAEKVVEDSVLGENTASSSASLSTDTQTSQGQKVKVFVPEGSVVGIYESPSLDSPVLAYMKSSQEVIKTAVEGSWVRINISSDNKEGWVNQDFIEEEKEAEETNSLKYIQITQTPTDFLRVREGPWGKEIAKVFPEDEFPLITEDKGWLQIILDDGTLGWVYKQYTTFQYDPIRLGQSN